MKKLKQLFCKHEYKFYTDSTGYSLFPNSSTKEYKYICPKCDKVIILNARDLKNEIDELAEIIRKKIVLREDISEFYENSEFVMRMNDYDFFPKLYRGRHISALKKKYRSRGIDLDEITHWCRK